MVKKMDPLLDILKDVNNLDEVSKIIDGSNLDNTQINAEDLNENYDDEQETARLAARPPSGIH